MPLFAGGGEPCGWDLVGSAGVLRTLGMPARLKAAPDGASLIGVPKAGAFENPPGDGELIVAGNPSSTDIIPVSTWRSPGVGLWTSKIPPRVSDHPRVDSAS